MQRYSSPAEGNSFESIHRSRVIPRNTCCKTGALGPGVRVRAAIQEARLRVWREDENLKGVVEEQRIMRGRETSR